jgi:hypothetical protein
LLTTPLFSQTEHRCRKENMGDRQLFSSSVLLKMVCPLSHWLSLLPPVRDMRAHGGEPIRGVEDLPAFTVLRRIDDDPFISEILHPFRGEGCPDDLPRQALHRFVFFWPDAVPAEDMESGMPPCPRCFPEGSDTWQGGCWRLRKEC